MEERRAKALGRAFRPSLDRLRITHDALKRKRVGKEVARLAGEALPGPRDFETLLYPAGVAWARAIPELGVWLLYRFDEQEITALILVDVRPVRVGD